jgi:hypothetical protein
MKNASFLQVEDNPAVERLSVDLYNMFQALSRAFNACAQKCVPELPRDNAVDSI